MELAIIIFLTGLTNDNKWKLITCCKKGKIWRRKTTLQETLKEDMEI